MTHESEEARPKVAFLQVVQSVLAAAFGVQSRRRYQQDFGSHSAAPFIVGGLIFASGFVGVLVLTVKLVLS